MTQPRAPNEPGRAAARAGTRPRRVVLDSAGIRRAAARIAHEILERNGTAEALVVVSIVAGGEPIGEMIRDRLKELSGHEVPLGALDVGNHFG